MSIFKVFLRVFLETFLTLLLLVNLLMFATYIGGVHPLGLPTTPSWDFRYYYFGYTSLINAFTDLGNSINYQDLLGYITDLNKELLDALPPLDEPNSILRWIIFIANTISLPVKIFLKVIPVIVYLVMVIVQFLTWFYKLVGGAYNVPIRS